MSERATMNAIVFSLVGGYVVARIAYGGPDRATWLDILVVIGAVLIGSATRLLSPIEIGKGVHDYDDVTVLSADTMTELADMEARLIRVTERAGMSIELKATSKYVRVYRRVIA